MDKENYSAERTTDFPKAPGMFVIKGRQTDHISLPTYVLYNEFKKFARIKDNATHFLKPPLDNFSVRMIKRAVDLVVSTMMIAGVLSWLIPLMAVLIKLDSKGPVFHLQKRIKKGGQVFTCIKFRSTIEFDDGEPSPAADDERITKLRRFLKSHYIDELPQFLNIWIGDMSLVGPRSHRISDNNKYEELIEFYDYRYKVKPGMTGLAQAMDFAGRTNHIQTIRNSAVLDIFYVRHWTYTLDLKIFFRITRKLIGY